MGTILQVDNINVYYGQMPYGAVNSAQNSAQNYFNNQQQI